MQERRKGREKG